MENKQKGKKKKENKVIFREIGKNKMDGCIRGGEKNE